MSNPQRITLYADSAMESPFPHRVRIGLEEAQVAYDIIWIPLGAEKPDWYSKKVSSEAKVPYLVYGGPKLSPDETPSPDTVQISESLVILEFLADMFPSAKLLPADPALRAKARLFALVVEPKLRATFIAFFFQHAPTDSLLGALEDMQRMLPPKGYAVGEWSIADAAFTPFLMRINMMLKLKPPTVQVEAVEQVVEALQSARFARLQNYLSDNVARPSMAKTWNEPAILDLFKKRFENTAKTNP